MSTREPGVKIVLKSNDTGSTPTIRVDLSFKVIERPIMWGSDANRRSQSPCVRITAGVPCHFASSSVKPRPSSGVMPKNPRKCCETSTPISRSGSPMPIRL